MSATLDASREPRTCVWPSLSEVSLLEEPSAAGHVALQPLNPEILAKFKALETKVQEDHQRVRLGLAKLMDSS